MLRTTLAVAVFVEVARAAQLFAHVQHVQALRADIKQTGHVPMPVPPRIMTVLAWLGLCGSIVLVMIGLVSSTTEKDKSKEQTRAPFAGLMQPLPENRNHIVKDIVAQVAP